MFKTYKNNELDSIVFEIKNNKAVIIPTDTVMGILANNENIIYQIKNRPKNKKIVKFILNLKEIGTLSDTQKKFINLFWPGEVTIVKNKISYRIPNDSNILYLLSKCGSLYCSSANLSDNNTIKDSSEVNTQFDEKRWFHNLVVLEGRPLGLEPSTIIDIDKWEILRKGSKINEINEFIKNYVHKNKTFEVLYDELYFGYIPKIKQLIINEQFKVEFKPLSEETIDQMSKNILNNNNYFGIVLTSDLNKWDILLNKKYLIRSAIIYHHDIASLSRQHDDANVGIFDFSLFDFDQNFTNIKNFIITNFEGGRHTERVQTIINYEKEWKI